MIGLAQPVPPARQDSQTTKKLVASGSGDQGVEIVKTDELLPAIVRS